MSRFFAQMFVKATAVFGKAFVTAYNQAVKGNDNHHMNIYLYY